MGARSDPDERVGSLGVKWERPRTRVRGLSLSVILDD